METVSENNRERGRPRKYERDQHGYTLLEFDRYESQPERGLDYRYIGSTRQQQNVILAERARDFFTEAHFTYGEGGDDTDRYLFTLLLYMPEVFGDYTKPPPQRVMTELGRLLSDGRTEDAAEGPRWKDGHSWVHRLRRRQ